MPSSNRIENVIRKHIRLFSILLFLAAALLLLLVFSLQKQYTSSPDIQSWWKVLEEIPKGILAASAVALLYDWVLKGESEALLVSTIRGELERIKFNADTVHSTVKVDSLIELVFSPLEDNFLPEHKKKFCRLNVHSRFVARYLGNELKLGLISSEDNAHPIRTDPFCIGYWALDEYPTSQANDGWMDVPNLRIEGVEWPLQKKINNGSNIILSFKRPKNFVLPPSKIVSYEFDVRTITNLISPKTITIFVHERRLRPTWRVDARPLKAKSVKSNLNTNLENVFQGPYVNAPEGKGTCQVFVNDWVEPGTNLNFTILLDDGLIITQAATN
jgi:hypothetical protein